MVGMTGRFYPEFQRAFTALNNGTIGRPIAYAEHMHFDASDLPDWYFQRAYAGGGVLLTNGIHSFDRILWLLQPQKVHILAAGCARWEIAAMSRISPISCSTATGLCAGCNCSGSQGLAPYALLNWWANRVRCAWKCTAALPLPMRLVSSRNSPTRSSLISSNERWLAFAARFRRCSRRAPLALPRHPLHENRRAFDLIMDVYRYAQGEAND